MNSSKTWTPGIFSEASEAEYSSKHFGGPTYKALNKYENNSAPESQPKLVLQFTSTASIYCKIVPQYLMLQVCQQTVIFSKKKKKRISDLSSLYTLFSLCYSAEYFKKREFTLVLLC